MQAASCFVAEFEKAYRSCGMATASLDPFTMASLDRCSSCGSFVVANHCPNCGGNAVRATRMGVMATLLGSSAFAMTLMACYGVAEDNDYLGDGGNTDDAGQDARSSSSSSSGSQGDDDDVTSGKDAGGDADADAPKDAATDG